MNYQKDYSSNGASVVYNGKEVYNDSMGYRTTVKDNLGTSYKNFVLMYVNNWAPSPSTNYIEFPLMSKYKQFKTTVGLEDKYQDSSALVNVEFLLDGNVIKTLEFKAGDLNKLLLLMLKVARN